MTELGEISRCYMLQYHRTSQHDPARLWRAITDEGEVSAWMGHPARIELRVGASYFVDFGGSDGALDGVIVQIETKRLLRYAWGLSVVEWAIESDGTGSRYTFTHSGVSADDTQDGVPAGLHAWLDDLEEFLSTGQPLATDDARWSALNELYRPRLAALQSGELA